MILTGRHLKVYLRDRSAVFFSLLSAFIIIGLMAFFLGDMNVDAILEIAGPFATAGAELETLANHLVLSWTFAGILSINAVSVSISVYSGMIRDRVTGKLNSIYTAPVSRLKIALSYIMAAWAAAVLVCVLSLGVMELFGVALRGGGHVALAGDLPVEAKKSVELSHGVRLLVGETLLHAAPEGLHESGRDRSAERARAELPPDGGLCFVRGVLGDRAFEFQHLQLVERRLKSFLIPLDRVG